MVGGDTDHGEPVVGVPTDHGWQILPDIIMEIFNV